MSSGLALAIQFSDLTKALVSRCMVSGFCLDEVGFRVEHGGGVRAAEQLAGTFLRPCIDQDGDIAVRLKLGDDRVQVRDHLDLPLLHRGDGAGPAAHTDQCRVRRGKAVLDQRVLRRQRRGGTRSRDADLQALEVGGRLHLVRQILAHGQHDAGEMAQFDDGLDILALLLHPDRMLVRPGHDIDRTADQRLERLGAAAEIVDRDIQAFLLEEAFLLGDGQR